MRCRPSVPARSFHAEAPAVEVATEEFASSAAEAHFAQFREQVVGQGHVIQTPFGEKTLLYADWTASGRLYAPLEERLHREVGPMLGNPHTTVNLTGSLMTEAYNQARAAIKRHVNAGPGDVLLCGGSGMTGALAKLQRMMGWKLPSRVRDRVAAQPPHERPVVFITHMEHHSNHTNWLEAEVDVVMIAPDERGIPDVADLARLLAIHADRPLKLASVIAHSNVTGIASPYYRIAELMHAYGGLCFVDFACSAPYVPIDMHPANPAQRLDAIFFSPHKFLGGPGTSGILLFDEALYDNPVPDEPGGGTVDWTTPWGKHVLCDDGRSLATPVERARAIEKREDGGTPPFLQLIRTAMAFQLKADMETDHHLLSHREHALVTRVLAELRTIPNLHLLGGDTAEFPDVFPDQPHIPTRLAIFSFRLRNPHTQQERPYNQAVQMLNDHFGIQVRGGWSCAGPYGHYLLDMWGENGQAESAQMADKIRNMRYYHPDGRPVRPGWVRCSLHPLMSDAEVTTVLAAIRQLATDYDALAEAYTCNADGLKCQVKAAGPSPTAQAQHWFRSFGATE